MMIDVLVAKPDGSQVTEKREVPDNWFDSPEPEAEPLPPVTPEALAATNQRVDELSASSDDIMVALMELAGMVAGGEADG